MILSQQDLETLLISSLKFSIGRYTGVFKEVCDIVKQCTLSEQLLIHLKEECIRVVTMREMFFLNEESTRLITEMIAYLEKRIHYTSIGKVVRDAFDYKDGQ